MSYLVAFFLLLLLILLLVILYYIIYKSFLEPGAVYYPTPQSKVEKIIQLAKIGPDDTVLDLGSGDGRFLIAAAKQGARAIGYENDPLLVKRSRQAIRQAGLSHLATVQLKSFWKADLNSATVITLYLFPRFMNRLQKILNRTLTHPIKLISYDYQFPNKKYSQKFDNIYLYRFKRSSAL